MSDADDDYPDDDDEPDDDLDHCPGCGAHLEEEHAWDCPYPDDDEDDQP